MYCRNCGSQVAGSAMFCAHCSAVQHTEQAFFVSPAKPKFYTAGFVLGILSVCLIAGWGVILALIGLPLACISKRKSAIILNTIGLAVGIAVWVLLFWWAATADPWAWPDFPEIEQAIRAI